MKSGMVLIAMLALVACRPDTVSLSYRYPLGRTLEYRLEAKAEASWDIGGRGRGSYTATFDVFETIESADRRGALVEVLMRPAEVVEEGLVGPGSQDRRFRLRLDASGGVVDVLEVDGAPARALDAGELAFIGTYRPPLALRPARLGAEWESEQEVQLGPVFQQIVTRGRLEGLMTDAGARLADVSYRGDGPLVWTTSLPEGEAELAGSARLAGRALMDVDLGLLRSASSVMSGDFEVRVVPIDRTAALAGTMHLDLELALRRIG